MVAENLLAQVALFYQFRSVPQTLSLTLFHKPICTATHTSGVPAVPSGQGHEDTCSGLPFSYEVKDIVH